MLLVCNVVTNLLKITIRMETKKNEIKEMNVGTDFKHVSIGDVCAFSEKMFLKDATGATSCELSFGVLNSGEAVPFFHAHKQNEEQYIVLSGAGDFQVNDVVFPIANGSVIRVATVGNRSLRCTSDEPLRYICIQAKEGSLEQYTMGDGVITDQEVRW